MENKIRCLIVDDEAPARRIIKGFLEMLSDSLLVGEAKNAIEAYNILHQEKVDLIFLDINMPEINGLGLLQMLKAPPAIILTTAYSEYGAESYDYDVIDYLLKPFRFERFAVAFDKVKTVLSRQVISEYTTFTPTHFEFKVEREKIKIPIDSILFLQSLGNYIKIVTNQNKYLTPLTTKNAEDFFKSANFIRIHKSIIVNKNYVDKHSAESVEIQGHFLPIGKTYRKYVAEWLNN